VTVLFPIVALMTVTNINRQKANSVRLLVEKGAALIRSFEAGTRTGMMGKKWGDARLQKLLRETAQQPDILYLLVADRNGTIVAHDDAAQIGKVHGRGLDLADIAVLETLRWHLVPGADGNQIFEVFRKFSPTGGPMGRHRGRMMFHRHFHPRRDETAITPAIPRIIFVGLDMSAIEEARQADSRHTILMGAILLLIGFAGIMFLFLFQSYRAARTSLSRVKAFSDHVVENMPIGLVALDGRKSIAACNQAAASILRRPADEIIGKDSEQILPAALARELEGLDDKRGPVEKEIDALAVDDNLLSLELSATSLEDHNRAFLGYVLLLRDLTEVHSLRKEIVRNQRLASVGRLAAGVAHEIRNPLSSIKGFATYFKERYRNIAEDRNIADIMIQEVDRLNRVVGQLLELARPINIAKRPIAVESLIANSLNVIARQATEKGIRIQTRLSSAVGEVCVDADKISQVLLNLYLNAIESMEEGGDLGIELTGHWDKKQIEIRISDTGACIRKEDLAHIFDPYFTSKASGTGLGLAIVHNIIEAHDGEIKVQSRPGAGTAVSVFLPEARKTPGTTQTGEEQANAKQGQNSGCR
jgi:two-component system sensor histidine kinase HydH